MLPDPHAAQIAAIFNAGWLVRLWCRPHQREKKAEAIRALGLIARGAFNATEDFGPLLYAIRDALIERS